VERGARGLGASSDKNDPLAPSLPPPPPRRPSPPPPPPPPAAAAACLSLLLTPGGERGGLGLPAADDGGEGCCPCPLEMGILSPERFLRSPPAPAQGEREGPVACSSPSRAAPNNSTAQERARRTKVLGPSPSLSPLLLLLLLGSVAAPASASIPPSASAAILCPTPAPAPAPASAGRGRGGGE